MLENEKQPLISVIMGVYNDKKFLSKSIDSILNQTYKNFEFIICDDCSNDGSWNILKKYEAKDERIKIIKNEKNLGLASSLNKCIKISKGNYIARMDSDDISIKDRFQKQIEYLENNPEISVIGTNVYYIDNSDHRYSKSENKTLKEISFQDTVKQTMLVHPSVMMRKQVLLDVGGYTVNDLTKRAEDYDLWCKMKEKHYKLQNIVDYLLEYREDISGIKKRKYSYRIQESKLKRYWIKRAKMPCKYYIYAIKPLIVGLIPKTIYKKLHMMREVHE